LGQASRLSDARPSAERPIVGLETQGATKPHGARGSTTAARQLIGFCRSGHLPDVSAPP